jgi:hypothetical protein
MDIEHFNMYVLVICTYFLKIDHSLHFPIYWLDCLYLDFIFMLFIFNKTRKQRKANNVIYWLSTEKDVGSCPRRKINQLIKLPSNINIEKVTFTHID